MAVFFLCKQLLNRFHGQKQSPAVWKKDKTILGIKHPRIIVNRINYYSHRTDYFRYFIAPFECINQQQLSYAFAFILLINCQPAKQCYRE